MDIQQKTRMTPRDFFLNLGALLCLYILVPALIALCFSIISVAFPNTGLNNDSYYYYSAPSISFSVATLIIVFPLYLVFSWLLGKSFVLDPEKRNIGFKKWITYITLFISAAIIAGDLVTLVYYFLDGRLLTTNFILKVVSVLVIAAAIFAYHIADLKEKLTRKSSMGAGIAVSVIIIAIIVIGFAVVGSPRTQRLVRYDVTKVQDLQSMQSQVTYFWQQKQRLPNTLEELNDPLSSYMVPTDTQTNTAYEYKKVSDTSFELCATFNKPTPKQQQLSENSYSMMNDQNWLHQGEKTCFTRTVDPERYPPFNK